MKKYIDKHFSQYSWEDVKMENLCGDVPDAWKNFSWDIEDEGSRKTESKRSSQRKTRKSSRISDTPSSIRSSRMSEMTESSYDSPMDMDSPPSSIRSSRMSEMDSPPSSKRSSRMSKSAESSLLKGYEPDSQLESEGDSDIDSFNNNLSMKGSQIEQQEEEQGEQEEEQEEEEEDEEEEEEEQEEEQEDEQEQEEEEQEEEEQEEEQGEQGEYEDEEKKKEDEEKKKEEKINRAIKRKIKKIKKIAKNKTSAEAEAEDAKDAEDEEAQILKSKIEKIKQIAKKKKGGATIMNFTPTQDFVRNYFSPFAPVKGMLLYHSVGTGKTCSAIAAASTNFEPFDYTILWVTRTTLKSDIWKNMFDQVCNKAIQDRIKAGEKIPDVQSERMRLLSKAWRIRPLSYKQFSNLVSKKNRYYDQLVKENGEADPLQKTLLIIDEAHKLYGGGDLSSIERPDMNALHNALMNSYAVSGMNSVRVLLMTATPITENPMELVKLVNLCKPIEQQMPDTFDLFASQYLKDDGSFTNNGQDLFLDNIAGYISYLNREKDARQFSQPRIQRVLVPMVSESQMKYVDDFDKFVNRSDSEDAVLKLQEELEKTLKQMETEIGVISKADFKSFYDICSQYNRVPQNKCNTIINKNTIALMQEIKGFIKPIEDKIKKAKTELMTFKKGQQSKLALIKRKIQQNPTLYAQYKASTYASMRENCSKKILSGTQFIEAVQQLPEAIEIDNEIQASKDKIKILENQLKTDIESSKQKIKQLKESLKNPNIPPVEKTAIEYSIRTTESGLNETKKMRTSQINDEIKAEKEQIKHNESAKKQFFSTVRKTLKKKHKLKQNDEKNAKKGEKQLQKTVASLSEIKNEDIKLMAQIREELIKYDLRELQRDSLKKEVEKMRKQREKEEANAEKEEKKRVQQTLKQREKIEEKERKNLEKMCARQNKTQKQKM